MLIFILLIFVFMDAVLFAFGSAIQSINVTEFEKEMEGGDVKAGRVLRIYNRPEKFVNTIQTLEMAFAIAIGCVIIRNFSKVWMAVLVAIISAMAMVSIGMVVPKRLAIKNPQKTAKKYIGLVRIVMGVFTPFTLIIRVISFVILRIFGIDPNKKEENVTEEDIMSMVNEGHEQGILEHSEAEMITNIFELNDKHAEDIMTHRNSLVCIDGDWTLEEAVDFILKEGNNSRFPVYEGDIDGIIGILNMKDALIFSNKGIYQEKKIKEIDGLLREANFIPEVKKLDALFKEMQSDKIHMEIVVDEYGQTAGIVTMEDILEEIVGNIMDEYDIDEEMITEIGDGSYIMKGMTHLEDVQETLHIEFTEEDYDNFDTLNGLIIAKIGHIPEDGEKFSLVMYGYEFTAIKVENKIIRSIKVTLHKDKEEDSTEDVKNS